MGNISIRSLADSVADAARSQGVRPNEVIDAVFTRESVNDSDIRSLVLSELGKRGGQKSARVRRHNAQVKKAKEDELRTVRDDMQQQEFWERSLDSNEHICPID